MALINCPECGKTDVSEKADNCPNCGYPFRGSFVKPLETKPKKQEPIKKWGLSGRDIGLLVFVCVVLLLWVRQWAFSDPEPSKTPEQLRKEKVETHFSVLDGSHVGLTRYIKQHMNDPDSYEHIETRFGDKGDHILVVTKFRGANAFGGKVINTITAKVDFSGNVLEIVSKN